MCLVCVGLGRTRRDVDCPPSTFSHGATLTFCAIDSVFLALPASKEAIRCRRKSIQVEVETGGRD